jgi:hypothetical protein
MRFLLPRTYANCKASKEKPIFYDILFPIMLFMPMASYTYYGDDVPFQWDQHAQDAFDSLKEALNKEPLISPPDYDKDYILYLSASEVSVVGVLVQVGNDQHEHVIYYISKNISGPPLKYNHEEKFPSPLSSQFKSCASLHPASHYKVMVDSNLCTIFLVTTRSMENSLIGSSFSKNTI